MAAPNTRTVRRRDGDGLRVEQRRFFQELADTGDPRRACASAEISWNRFKTWLQRDRHFQTAFDNALGPAVDIVREMLETSATKAAGVLDEALDSNESFEQDVVCPNPECGHQFTTRVQIPNWAIRLRAGEMILKGARVLKDSKEIKFEGTMTHLTMDQHIALAAFKAGRTIPPNARSELERAGLLTEAVLKEREQYLLLTEGKPA